MFLFANQNTKNKKTARKLIPSETIFTMNKWTYAHIRPPLVNVCQFIYYYFFLSQFHKQNNCNVLIINLFGSRMCVWSFEEIHGSMHSSRFTRYLSLFCLIKNRKKYFHWNKLKFPHMEQSTSADSQFAIATMKSQPDFHLFLWHN